jgi:hypothetical protein
MSQTPNTAIAVIGIIGKNSFDVVGHDARGLRRLRRMISCSPWPPSPAPTTARYYCSALPVPSGGQNSSRSTSRTFKKRRAACSSRSGTARPIQEREGRTVAIVRGSLACPVRAVRKWLDAAAITGGPVFRAVGRYRTAFRQTSRPHVQAFAERMRLDVSTFGGHSLRAGFLTSAAAKHANVFRMRDVSGHKSMDVLQGYVRSAEAFQDHAGAGLL